jgi:hypothetical protein
MGEFKPMVKMMTTEPSVELKLKKGGHVSSKHAQKGDSGHKPMRHMMDGGVMKALSRAPSIAPAMSKPGLARAMSARRAMGAPLMKEGGESPAMHKAEMKKMGKIEGELKAHEKKPASKAHAGLKTGGVVMGQGGFKKGGGVPASGIIKSTSGKTKMVTASKYAKGGGVEGNVSSAKPGVTNTTTGDVRLGNAGGFKKGGASKKHFATGGAVNDSGHAVAMPKKAPSSAVAIDRLSGTFKRGGYVKKQTGGDVTSDREQRALDKAYQQSLGPSKEEMDMARTIRSIPENVFKSAKRVFGFDEKPAGSVTKTEKSVTVSPAKKRGGLVKC